MTLLNARRLLRWVSGTMATVGVVAAAPASRHSGRPAVARTSGSTTVMAAVSVAFMASSPIFRRTMAALHDRSMTQSRPKPYVLPTGM